MRSPRLAPVSEKKVVTPPKICRNAATFPSSPWGTWPRALRIKRNGAATSSPVPQRSAWRYSPVTRNIAATLEALEGMASGETLRGFGKKIPPCALF